MTAPINLDLFPPRIETTPRKVFFDELCDADASELTYRGYDAVRIMSLPRDSVADHQNYLFALLQGMSEGTIVVNKHRIEAAELEMRVRKMLNKDSSLLTTTAAVSGDLDSVWDWTPSRNTLQGNSTVVDPRRIDEMGKMLQDAASAVNAPRRVGRPRKVKPE
jgi:hypothetical protein